jgi:AcrR family transcriptional regulator
MSLRHRQKTKRAREIIDSAVALFEKLGYENTTVEDIAGHAFVAPGTVYNYFGSKDGLLRQILQVHISERRVERENFFEHLPDDTDKALERFVELLLDRAFVLVNRELWRQILASGISNARDRNDLLAEVTGVLVSQFEQLFKRFRSRGKIPIRTPLRDLAEAAMGIADFHFYRLVCNDEITIAEIKIKIRVQLKLLLGGATSC